MIHSRHTPGEYWHKIRESVICSHLYSKWICGATGQEFKWNPQSCNDQKGYFPEDQCFFERIPPQIHVVSNSHSHNCRTHLATYAPLQCPHYFWLHICTKFPYKEHQRVSWCWCSPTRLDLFPGAKEGRRKSAWYTLFGHALNCHGITVFVHVRTYTGEVINLLRWCASSCAVGVLFERVL